MSACRMFVFILLCMCWGTTLAQAQKPVAQPAKNAEAKIVAPERRGSPQVADVDRSAEVARAGNGYTCNPMPHGSTICSCTTHSKPGEAQSCDGMEALCMRLGGKKASCHTYDSGITGCACSFVTSK